MGRKNKKSKNLFWVLGILFLVIILIFIFGLSQTMFFESYNYEKKINGDGNSALVKSTELIDGDVIFGGGTFLTEDYTGGSGASVFNVGQFSKSCSSGIDCERMKNVASQMKGNPDDYLISNKITQGGVLKTDQDTLITKDSFGLDLSVEFENEGKDLHTIIIQDEEYDFSTIKDLSFNYNFNLDRTKIWDASNLPIEFKIGLTNEKRDIILYEYKPENQDVGKQAGYSNVGLIEIKSDSPDLKEGEKYKLFVYIHSQCPRQTGKVNYEAEIKNIKKILKSEEEIQGSIDKIENLSKESEMIVQEEISGKTQNETEIKESKKEEKEFDKELILGIFAISIVFVLIIILIILMVRRFKK